MLAEGLQPSISLRSNLDMQWFRIAVEHERAALNARDRVHAAPAGSQEMGEAIDDETRATMVAVAAAAFAIDAMHEKLGELLGPARPLPKGLVGRIVRTFEVALRLGVRTQRWQTGISDLFGQRGDLVHFVGEALPGFPHPSGVAHVSREAAIYNVATATAAVDLALEVLTTAHRAPRRDHPAVVEWASRDAHVADYLEQVRRGESR